MGEYLDSFMVIYILIFVIIVIFFIFSIVEQIICAVF